MVQNNHINPSTIFWDLLQKDHNVFQVLLWDMVSMKLIRSLEGHHHDVCGCDFSPDGAILATSSYDTRIILWDPHIGDILTELG